MKGKKLWEERGTVQSASNRMCEVFVLEEKANWPEVYFIRLELRAGKQLLSENFYWETTSRTARDFTVLNRLPVTRLTGRCRVREENGIVKARIIVENPTDKVALAVKLNVRDKDTGKAVLPAYFSDGYFTLLPFEKKEIGLEFTADGKNNRQITAEGYNVRLQELSDL
nr:glycoside hydrolase family 2 protein [uncultured Culturomica sp.]